MILIQAEIGYTSDENDGYISSYWIGVKATEDSITTKYTHNPIVDGDTTYGTTSKSFPRRCIVGGNMVYQYDENAIQYPGSRSMISNLTPGSVFGNVSY